MKSPHRLLIAVLIVLLLLSLSGLLVAALLIGFGTGTV